MSTEAIGSQSGISAYEYLKSPFTEKSIKINSSTPYDKVEETKRSEVYSRAYFNVKPQTRLRYSISQSEDNSALKLNKTVLSSDSKSNTVKTGVEDSANQAFNPEITSFSKSSLSSKDIVNNALKQGYSKEQAVMLNQAQAAYGKGAFLTKDPVGSLSSCSYIVS